MSVLVYMSIIENVKRQKEGKEKKKKATQPAVIFFDAVRIPPHQRKGTETGKESIWRNQSIYKCTKYITYIKRVPFSVVFPIFVGSGRNYFLTDWTGRRREGPSVFTTFQRTLSRCCCRRCRDDALRQVQRPAQDKMGPHSLLFQAATHRHL